MTTPRKPRSKRASLYSRTHLAHQPQSFRRARRKFSAAVFKKFWSEQQT